MWKLMERSLSRQLATCVEILIARYILHLPWQPKIVTTCSAELLRGALANYKK